MTSPLTWNSNMLSIVSPPAGVPSPVHSINAAQALFHYKNSPAHRAMSPSFYAPPAYSPVSPSASPLASQPPLSPSDIQALALPCPIPKARNAFIIFRSHFISSGQAKGVRLQNDISRLAADTWRAMSDDDKAEWRAKAAEEKKERGEKAKALEGGFMASPALAFMGIPARQTPAGRKAQLKKERAKAAAVAAALKKESDSARKVEKRKVDLKKPSSPTCIQLPVLTNGPLVRPDSRSSPATSPSSQVSSLNPYIIDPNTHQSHVYDSPLDADNRNPSPTPLNFQRVAGEIQIIEPNTQTLFVPNASNIQDFEGSLNNPWLSNAADFTAPYGRQAAQNISLANVFRSSALAKRQMQIMWPGIANQQMGGTCIDPKILENTAAMQSPSSSSSSSDFASPSSSQQRTPSPYYSLSRTPSPLSGSNASYTPAPVAYQYPIDFGSQHGSVHASVSNNFTASKNSMAFNAYAPQPQVTISSPQTDMNSEWAIHGAPGEGDFAWLSAQMAAQNSYAAGAILDPSMTMTGYQGFANTDGYGLGMNASAL